MKDLYFDHFNDLQDYVYNHKVKSLGSGREGTCFLLDDNSVIKILYSDYYSEYALQFKDIDSATFVFAKNCTFVKDYVRAIMMEYVEGDSLSKHKPIEQRIDLLGDKLQILTDSLDDISSKGILVKDFHCGNLIYDGNNFKVVDTLPYLYLPGNNYKNENLYEVMNRIYSFLLDDIMKYKKISKEFGYIGNIDRLDNPAIYLSYLKEELENSTDQEINTLGDANKVLKKKYTK